MVQHIKTTNPVNNEDVLFYIRCPDNMGPAKRQHQAISVLCVSPIVQDTYFNMMMDVQHTYCFVDLGKS